MKTLTQIVKAVLFSSFLLSALSCTTTAHVKAYGSIERTQRSITLPAGGDDFVAAMKDALANDGWDIFVVPLSQLTTLKSDSENVTTRQFKTRYAMVAETQYVRTHCVFIDASIFDLRTGKEVLTANARAASSANIDRVNIENSVVEIMARLRQIAQ